MDKIRDNIIDFLELVLPLKEQIIQMRIDNPSWSYAEIGREFISKDMLNGISRECVRKILSKVDL